MLTRCPACATTFRVTPEQLKVRTGTVRCGACQQIFNGIDQLIDDPSIVAVQRPAAPERIRTVPPTVLPVAGPTVVPTAPPPDMLSPPFMATPEPVAIATLPEMAAPEDDVIAAGTVPAPLDFDLSEPDANSATKAMVDIGGDAVPPGLTFDPTATADTEPATRPDAPTDTAAAGLTEVEAVAEPAPEPAAGTTSESQPVPSRRAPRWPWTAGVTLAAILFIHQGLIHYRVELATLVPESRPMLEALCDAAGCRVGLPARVDLVGIEASDLIPDPARKGRLTLAATLRNRAPFAQEHPLLELTLTDTANAAVARKILHPVDYLPKDTDPALGIPAGKDLLLQVALDAEVPGATGYRLYLFYP